MSIYLLLFLCLYKHFYCDLRMLSNLFMEEQMVTKSSTHVETPAEEIKNLVSRAQTALGVLETMDQETINHIVHRMAIAGLDQHMALAKMAVEETGRGIVEDKAVKNLFATEEIWHNIKYNKTCGVISDSDVDEMAVLAVPVGVVAAIVPVTNPTSTTLFKALICLKTRNPVIFSFHPGAPKCSAAAAKIVYDAAVAAGAPKDCIQWVEAGSMEKTTLLINDPGVAIVLATGGSAMVKAAYSTGKPALGVGPGNVPSYLEKSCDIRRAVNDVIMSKTFDNGMICASEQAVIVDTEIYEAVKAEFKKNFVYFATKKDIKALEDAMFNEEKTGIKGAIPGMSAIKIAQLAGITVPDNTKMIIAELDSVGPQNPLSREKLSPVLAMFKANSTEHGFDLCEQMVEFDGLGHSAAIHSADNDIVMAYSARMKVCRILVNSPSSQGGIGDVYNNNIPSLTLGCGTYGKNSVSKNVTTVDLIQTKTVAKRRNNMQWIKLPPRIFFEENSIRYLRVTRDIKRVFIVADEGMVKFGYVDRIIDQLKQRASKVEYAIFSDIMPDPDTNTVYKGVEKINDFKPDTIIAVGGGSVMDAAKVIWLFYEKPDLDFFGAKQKYLDIRKRTYKIHVEPESQLICVPTTSGTGSEVTPFAVITDSNTHIKYPLADYSLTPSIAIIDPAFVYSVPKATTADTGMDVLAHAIEAYVSVMASDFTKGLSLQAIKLVFENLKKSYETGDKKARESMHNASTIAGMAFANALLGINHSLAHKIGGQYPVPHGRAIATLMPHVIRYNGSIPSKHSMWAKYEFYRADEDYAEIARMLHLPGTTTAELVESLAAAIEDLGTSIGIKMTFKEQGIDEKNFLDAVDQLSEMAYEDQCTPCNPRQPLISELRQLLLLSYYGAEKKK